MAKKASKKACPPPACPEKIRIGTLVNAGPGKHRPGEYIRQILPYGFESFSLTFWQTLGDCDLQEARRRGPGRPVGHRARSISSLSIFGNPLMGDDMARQTSGRLAEAHRRGRAVRLRPGHRLHRALERQAHRAVDAGVQEGLQPACPAGRRQGRPHRVRELRDGRQLAARRLEHRPQPDGLGDDVQRGADGQHRPGVGALPPDGQA